jgi:hypothetical protein
MNAPSEDIKSMLVAGGLGLTFGTNLFIGKEPATPRNCATIFDTYGRPPDLALKDQGYERPSIQMRIRSTDYMTGWTLTNNIKDLLHGKEHETWNGTLYTVIYCSSGPALLDWDDNNNARFIINFSIQRHAV